MVCFKSINRVNPSSQFSEAQAQNNNRDKKCLYRLISTAYLLLVTVWQQGGPCCPSINYYAYTWRRKSRFFARAASRIPHQDIFTSRLRHGLQEGGILLFFFWGHLGLFQFWKPVTSKNLACWFEEFGIFPKFWNFQNFSNFQKFSNFHFLIAQSLIFTAAGLL